MIPQKSITINIDKLIDTIIVVGDNVDENAIANQVLTALHKAVENDKFNKECAFVASWAQPERPKTKKITLEDLRAMSRNFKRMYIPRAGTPCADFIRASIETAKEREERIAAMHKDFDLWCRYYFPRWHDNRPFFKSYLK